nr:Arm DNA-binding domain-containing protein [Caballeronia udeis]
MYVHVTAKGGMSFRMDYRLNGRRGTIYLGKYGPDGLSLARAREKCIDARRNIVARYSHCSKRPVPETRGFASYQTAGAATRPDFFERPITAPVKSFNTCGTCVRRGSN